MNMDSSTCPDHAPFHPLHRHAHLPLSSLLNERGSSLEQQEPARNCDGNLLEFGTEPNAHLEIVHSPLLSLPSVGGGGGKGGRVKERRDSV